MQLRGCPIVMLVYGRSSALSWMRAPASIAYYYSATQIDARKLRPANMMPASENKIRQCSPSRQYMASIGIIRNEAEYVRL